MPSFRRTLVALTATLLAAGPLVVAHAAPTVTDNDRVTSTCDNPAEPLTIPHVASAPDVSLETITVTTVDGSTLYGCVAYPTDLAPDSPVTLVTMAHGTGHYVQRSWAQHVISTVAHGNESGHPTVAVAINYRDNFGFPILRGAQDLITIAQRMKATYHVTRSILVGVSLGGAVSGTAIVEGPSGLWDTWVDLEGIVNLVESYTEARVLAVAVPIAGVASAGSERDAGGTLEQKPQEYTRRSPLLRVNEFVSQGIREVAVVHSNADGLVGYHQSVKMTAALCGLGIPTTFDTMTRGSGNSDDTTLPGYAPGVQAVNNSTIDLTGHGSEADAAHPVMAQGLHRLFELLDGTARTPAATVTGAPMPNQATTTGCA